MSQALSIDRQVTRLVDAFVRASGDSAKLATVERSLMALETTLWLAEFEEAAVFCIELQRLIAHQTATCEVREPKLIESSLHRLAHIGDARFTSGLLSQFNDLRRVRGASPFDRANNLEDVRRTVWREMTKRGNAARKLRRLLATVADLVDALADEGKAKSALQLLARQAEAGKVMFRFNPSSVLWASVVDLTELATVQAGALVLHELKRYCQRLSDESADAKSLAGVRPALRETADHIARFDEAHPLPKLLAMSVEELAPKAREPDPPLPSEVRALTEALGNLLSQVEAGVLEGSPQVENLTSLAQQALDSHSDADERLAHYSPQFEQLTELMDLLASGVTPTSVEVDAIHSDLQGYLSAPQSLRQIDEAMQSLQQLRTRVLQGAGQPDMDALVSLTGQLRPDEDTSGKRFYGFLLTRGGLAYAVRHADEMRVERWSPECSEPAIDSLFPQSETLDAPRMRLTFECLGERLGLACDHIQGPMWIDLESRMPDETGFAMSTDGTSLCLLNPALVRSHCQ